MFVLKDVAWFKQSIAPRLIGYEIEYRFWEEGDFGSLNQVMFNSAKMGGGIDFWGQGWTGIHLVDYSTDDELMNILLLPSQESEKEEFFKKLVAFLFPSS